MISFLLVLGVALVLPLATGGRWRAWWVAAASAGLALRLAPGAGAAVLVLPWLAVAGYTAGHRLRAYLAAGAAAPPAGAPAGAGAGAGLADGARVLAAGYAVVAGGAFAASRLGIGLFGVGEPIVELTAIHYTYAGCAALTLAALALDRATGRRRLPALAAVVLTAGAPPVVAVGFVAGAALPQVGGAVLMTLGVWCTASLHLREAVAGGPAATGPRRVLLAVSGLSVWAPMVLAVAWAAGQHWDVPFLSIRDMARTHGVGNAIGFTVAGLFARQPRRTPLPLRTGDTSGPPGGYKRHQFGRRRPRAAGTGAFHVGRLSVTALDRRLADASAAPGVSYPEIGCTLVPGATPSFTRTLGHGPAAFDGAVQGLREWAPQLALGARVHPPDAPITIGTTVLIVLRAGPLEVVARDRIVVCVDEPGRFGFAYGTLPGHPERGEESFLVRLLPDGTVTGTVTVVAGPGSWPAKLGGPVLGVLQRWAVRRYLAALHAAATAAAAAAAATSA
ncbi:MAG: hypothetical protein QOG43_77 [Actinomycetota bacterium]|jgi:uncharacterized protein (UPF0548 family)|nr:hypothetical protein [Actinomycetota bacterium]